MTTEKILSAITKAIEQSPVPVGGVLISVNLFCADIVEGYTDALVIRGTDVRVFRSSLLKQNSFALLQLPITITE